MKHPMASTSYQRSLIVAGALVFLFGLLQGAAVPVFANPRMALSAHLTAVQSGTALMVVGVVWPLVSLAPRLDLIARFAITSGIYGLWLGLTLAAATGASNNLPIAGAGYQANAAVETGVSVIVLGSSLVMTMGWALFVYGLVCSRQR